jgi:Na+-translocating ferredoxin:NAD+ oxidoreductase RnfE subunit
MTTKQPKSLYKAEEPKTINIPVGIIILASFLFALMFFIVGSVFRYYIPMGV